MRGCKDFVLQVRYIPTPSSSPRSHRSSLPTLEVANRERKSVRFLPRNQYLRHDPRVVHWPFGEPMRPARGVGQPPDATGKGDRPDVAVVQEAGGVLGAHNRHLLTVHRVEDELLA